MPERSRDGDLAAVVAVGGVIGALARFGIDRAVPRVEPAAWPWATFLVNALGAFLLGIVLVWLLTRVSPSPRVQRWSRPFLVTGVLGGFTTFSAFSVQVRDLAASGSLAAAVAYAVGSVVVAVAAVAGGSALARRWWGPVPIAAAGAAGTDDADDEGVDLA